MKSNKPSRDERLIKVLVKLTNANNTKGSELSKRIFGDSRQSDQNSSPSFTTPRINKSSFHNLLCDRVSLPIIFPTLEKSFNNMKDTPNDYNNPKQLVLHNTSSKSKVLPHLSSFNSMPYIPLCKSPFEPESKRNQAIKFDFTKLPSLSFNEKFINTEFSSPIHIKEINEDAILSKSTSSPAHIKENLMLSKSMLAPIEELQESIVRNSKRNVDIRINFRMPHFLEDKIQIKEVDKTNLNKKPTDSIKIAEFRLKNYFMRYGVRKKVDKKRIFIESNNTNDLYNGVNNDISNVTKSKQKIGEVDNDKCKIKKEKELPFFIKIEEENVRI